MAFSDNRVLPSFIFTNYVTLRELKKCNKKRTKNNYTDWIPLSLSAAESRRHRFTPRHPKNPKTSHR